MAFNTTFHHLINLNSTGIAEELSCLNASSSMHPKRVFDIYLKSILIGVAGIARVVGKNF